MKVTISLFAIALLASVSAVALAKPKPTMAAAPAAPPSDAHAMSAPQINQLGDIKWGPGPAALPPGSELAVMAGDPGAKGFVSLRAKLPAGYTVPPHWHPTDEHVTVLSGEMQFGDGDKIDAKAARTLKPGGYFNAGANMHHYAVAKTAAVIQIDLEGPFEITYVNAADDPRKKSATP